MTNGSNPNNFQVFQCSCQSSNVRINNFGLFRLIFYNSIMYFQEVFDDTDMKDFDRDYYKANTYDWQISQVIFSNKIGVLD